MIGKTFTNDSDTFMGTMVDNGAINQTITTQGGQVLIPEGYHPSGGVVKAEISPVTTIGTIDTFYSVVKSYSQSFDEIEEHTLLTLGSGIKSFSFIANSNTGTYFYLKGLANGSYSTPSVGEIILTDSDNNELAVILSNSSRYPDGLDAPFTSFAFSFSSDYSTIYIHRNRYDTTNDYEIEPSFSSVPLEMTITTDTSLKLRVILNAGGYTYGSGESQADITIDGDYFLVK